MRALVATTPVGELGLHVRVGIDPNRIERKKDGLLRVPPGLCTQCQVLKDIRQVLVRSGAGEACPGRAPAQFHHLGPFYFGVSSGNAREVVPKDWVLWPMLLNTGPARITATGRRHRTQLNLDRD